MAEENSSWHLFVVELKVHYETIEPKYYELLNISLHEQVSEQVQMSLLQGLRMLAYI